MEKGACSSPAFFSSGTKGGKWQRTSAPPYVLAYLSSKDHRMVNTAAVNVELPNPGHRRCTYLSIQPQWGAHWSWVGGVMLGWAGVVLYVFCFFPLEGIGDPKVSRCGLSSLAGLLKALSLGHVGSYPFQRGRSHYSPVCYLDYSPCLWLTLAVFLKVVTSCVWDCFLLLLSSTLWTQRNSRQPWKPRASCLATMNNPSKSSLIISLWCRSISIG